MQVSFRKVDESWDPRGRCIVLIDVATSWNYVAVVLRSPEGVVYGPYTYTKLLPTDPSIVIDSNVLRTNNPKSDQRWTAAFSGEGQGVKLNVPLCSEL
jgi:hypothetical protein